MALLSQTRAGFQTSTTPFLGAVFRPTPATTQRQGSAMADSPPPGLPCGEAEGLESTLEEGLREMGEQQTASQLAAAHTVRVG